MKKTAPSMIAVIGLCVAVVTAGPAAAGKWSLQLEPMFVEIHGHDQHVLNRHTVDLTSGFDVAVTSAESLDTQGGLGWRLQAERSGAKWDLGIAMWSVNTEQFVAVPTVSGSGAASAVAFEVAGRSFLSTDPSAQLSYGVLEDTSVQMWTLDFYARRPLVEGSTASLDLLIGLRTADFDNDYRAVVGILDREGTRLDSSSNYDRMHGPLVGFVARFGGDRGHLEASLSQSMLLTSVELAGDQRHFTGPFADWNRSIDEIGTPLALDRFHKVEDVVVPVTELRVQWTRKIGGRVTVGGGLQSSAWWDLPVPPGVVPGPGRAKSLNENTIVVLGLFGLAKYSF